MSSVARALLVFAVAASCVFVPSVWGQSSQVVRVDLDRVIHPLSVELVEQGVEKAERENAAAVLITLNTPGGLLSATEQINQAIIASEKPVITYVTPSGGRAASAGFLILITGDVAAMAPGTNTGAAHPVLVGGGEMDEIMKQKVENDTAASVRAIAEKRGRDAELAQEAVLESRAFTEEEALESNLIDLVAADIPALLKELDGRSVIRFSDREETLALTGASIVPIELSLRQQILLPLTDPNLAFILLALGALGIYIEFTNPGLVFPGVFGGLLLLIGMMALSLLPINWAGAALIVFGLACFVFEAFTVANGVFTVGGAVAMVLGAVMLVDTGVPELSISWGTALAVTIPFALVTAFLLGLAVRSFRLKVTTGVEGLVGEEGVAKTAVAADGRVFVHGELWNASSAQPIPEGARVRVTEVSGLRVRVESLSTGSVEE